MRSLCTAFAGLGPSATVYAQETGIPARLSLEDALRIAEARNPQVISAEHAISASEADVTGAGKRPNPVLTFISEGYPFSEANRPSFVNDQEIEFSIEQEFELGGRRGHRSEVARHERPGAELLDAPSAVQPQPGRGGQGPGPALMAAAKLAQTEMAVSLDVQQALNALDVSRRRIAYVEAEYLTSARETRDIVLASYRAGAATLIDYLVRRAGTARGAPDPEPRPLRPPHQPVPGRNGRG